MFHALIRFGTKMIYIPPLMIIASSLTNPCLPLLLIPLPIFLSHGGPLSQFRPRL